AAPQRMREEAPVVALGEIEALVRAPRFLAVERRGHHGAGDLDHELELESSDELGVERLAVVIQTDVERPLLELADPIPGVPQPRAGAEDPGVLLHDLLHRLTKGGDAVV